MILLTFVPFSAIMIARILTKTNRFSCSFLTDIKYKGAKTCTNRSTSYSILIQTKFQYSDRELVEQIAENSYLQYFIGLPGFREEAPFDAGTLVLFRKRISADMLMEVNEYLLAHKDDDKDDHTPPSGGKSGDDGTAKEDTNKGIRIYQANYDRIYNGIWIVRKG